MLYSLERASWQGERFAKEFPTEKQYRHSLKEEISALSLVASSLEEQLKDKKIQLDAPLAFLLELKQQQMLEPYVLLLTPDQGLAQDYLGYRAAHRDKLVRMRTVLVRTGKFRPDVVERSRVQPDGIVSSLAQLPEWIEDHL